MWWARDSSIKALQPISAALHAITLRVQNLEESLAALQDKHERLRGRFYATRGPDSPPQTESKAEILKRMGFMR